MPDLTPTYGEALAYATDLHRGQTRKGTAVPYVSHLLAVSALVLEAGGTEEQAIAGLLHDALEDQGDRTSYAQIADRFGAEVARIVRACSDTEAVPKPPWRARKEAYLAHLESADVAVLQVSLADKLHNARSLVTDVLAVGVGYLDRFSAGVADQLWYYGALVDIFTRRLPGNAQAAELGFTVARLRVLVTGAEPISSVSCTGRRPAG